jgi:hypothetical protein
MPVNIYVYKTKEKIKHLCEGNWSLPNQVWELESWLIKNYKSIPKGEYVADIGFGIRKDASGGGAVLSKDTMKIMSDIGMDLYLSEYPIKNVK